MADIALQPRAARPQIREATAWDQLRTNRNWLGFWFMLPAMAVAAFSPGVPMPEAGSARSEAWLNTSFFGSAFHTAAAS